MLFIIYFSNKGIKGRTISPPRKIPKAASLKLGSIIEAIKSAHECAIITPIIPAIKPLEINFKNLFSQWDG